MPFPVGASTITVTGPISSPVGGGGRSGQIVFTPTATLVDSTNHAIYSGGGSVTITAGVFSVVLLCTDDPDVQPTGWRWRVDEQPTGGQRRTYWINLPSTLGPTVSLDALAPVASPSGTGQSLPPTGPAGGALTGSYPNPQLAAATIASFDPAGAAAAAQTAAASALAAHEADTTNIHGIADTSTLETQAGAQAKATAAQTAATTAASSALAAHEADTTAVHGIADTAALETSTGATAKVTAHKDALDPHGDRAWADGKFATQAALSTLDGFVNDALTRVSAIEGGTAWLSGLQVAGNAVVSGGDLTVSDFTKGYRFRRGGSALDFEATGADMILSNWSGTGFNGTQRAYLRLSADAQNVQVAGQVEFVDALYGATKHTLDPATGVAALGAKNGLTSIRLCGRRASAGSPTTGTWTAGDAVQDSAGTWWLCTADGTPGTWTSPPATPTAHASTHGSGGTDPVTVAQSQVTGLAAALAALLPLTGGTMTGTVTNNVASAATTAFGGGVSGDTFDRWRVLANGTLELGPGNAARDTNLRRSGANELTTDDALIVSLMFRHLGTTLGFYGATAVAKPAVTGSRGGNAALASLLTALAGLGLITDSTTA